jgi:hydrogenase/urease accessory protein HupE
MFTASGIAKARQPAPKQWMLWACFFLWILSGVAEAHPVAQGAILVTISPRQLTVRATVSLEEVLVAAAYRSESTRAKSPVEAAQRHGAYLLEHLRISADGRRLHGRLIQSTVPASKDPSEAGDKPRHFVYEFAYPVDNPASEFRFEEDVLNEFEFAPGNRWEASYIVQVTEDGHASREGLLLTSRQPLVFAPEGRSAPASAAPQLDRWRVIRDYFHHGLLHILTGYDHLLFITALVLSVRSLWELVKVITAFTLAHSITLALSAFDLFRLPATVVEPVVAGSIIFVALQNVFWPERTRGWTRLAVAFFFGLFHGLGFAGALLEAMQGLSSRALLLALFGFSAGVEAGHQVVVLPIFSALKLARSWRRDPTQSEVRALLISRWGSAAISLAGMVYLAAALKWW